jgi:hypothetical protein
MAFWTNTTKNGSGDSANPESTAVQAATPPRGAPAAALKRSAGESSNAKGRKRDATILELLAQGPVTLFLLLLIGLFKSKSAASRRMSILERIGAAVRMKNVFLPELRNGRSMACWCNAPCKADNLRHNAYVNLFLGLYHSHLTDVVCGYDTDAYWRPDATFTIGGERFHLEVFLGRPHMGKGQVQERMRLYLGDETQEIARCEDTILVVTLSKEAAGRVLEWCAELDELVYVATLDSLLLDRFGEVWTSVDGSKLAIEVDKKVDGQVIDNKEGR